MLLVTLCVSAVVGDSVGYSIGYKTGPRIFNRERSWFFNKEHLLKAQAFYERHGGKTIILARFMPLLRTFAPVVAGAGKMEYRRFGRLIKLAGLPIAGQATRDSNHAAQHIRMSEAESIVQGTRL